MELTVPILMPRRSRPPLRLVGAVGRRWRAPRRHLPLWYLLSVRNEFKALVLPKSAFFDSDYILTRHDLATVDQRFKPRDFSTAPNTTHRYKHHDYSTAPKGPK